MTDPDAKLYLDLAARVASRAFGLAEPNPMVGAVIVKDNQIVGIGHHRRYGELHAERDALKNCRENRHDPRGATLYCTLEPCCHHGKQPPCTDAVIEAGITRVVIASRDPHELSGGGWDTLTQAGISVELSDASPNAIALSQPFLQRLATKRPWVIAKWAQTLEGRIESVPGQSPWISNPRCRSRVHRLRAKVDAVLIGIGTALADDPMLTPRDCRSIRRTPKRVVLDTHAQLPLDSKLVRSADSIPTIVYTSNPERFASTRVIAEPAEITDSRIDLHACLHHLHEHHAVSTLLSESGPTLINTLIEHNLVNEALVHVGGAEVEQVHALGKPLASLDASSRYQLVRTKRIGSDLELHYRGGSS